MSHDYELIYFDLHAKAEPIRLCFVHAKADWKDTRVLFEAWPELKSTMPNGQVPVLKCNGQVMNESVAILRFVGK